jgi:hypothetical protein
VLKPSSQASKLLPDLFRGCDPEVPLTVLDVGAALPDTVSFFSGFRCKLHFLDVYADLPVVGDDDNDSTLQQRFAALLDFPADTRFDVCLFWDLFNFFDRESIAAFLQALQPYLHTSCQGHAFSVHNRKTPQSHYQYGIEQLDAISCRTRKQVVPGYSPHSQRELGDMMHCFKIERSVLLADSRLELLLQARV